MEEWKNIEGYDKYYEVSNEGRIRSCSKIILTSDNKVRHYKEKILKGGVMKNGYPFVILVKDKTKKVFYIHRLVASAFLDNVKGYTEVNHKDEDKTNNRVDNLEYCDRKYNMNYGTVQNRKGVSKKEFHKRKKGGHLVSL